MPPMIIRTDPITSATSTSEVLPLGISRPNSCGPMMPPIPVPTA